LRGLWAQFLPAWALLMGVWLYFQTVFGDSNDTFPSEHFLSVCFFIVSFATLPIVGLYYSLRPGNFATAVFFTLLVGIILPVILAYLVVYLVSGDTAPAPLLQAFTAAFLQVLTMLVLGTLLKRNLVTRNFAF
jgi:ABC-type transport system involved in multi-copper enzyme maturation permease subunit